MEKSTSKGEIRSYNQNFTLKCLHANSYRHLNKWPHSKHPQGTKRCERRTFFQFSNHTEFHYTGGHGNFLSISLSWETLKLWSSAELFWFAKDTSQEAQLLQERGPYFGCTFIIMHLYTAPPKRGGTPHCSLQELLVLLQHAQVHVSEWFDLSGKKSYWVI